MEMEAELLRFLESWKIIFGVVFSKRKEKRPRLYRVGRKVCPLNIDKFYIFDLMEIYAKKIEFEDQK